MTTRKLYSEELVQLSESLEEMGNLVEASLKNLFFSIENKDMQLAERIVADDRNVNNLERSIEAQCLMLITTQQPIAQDLRTVSSILKVVTDIERIGDHASDIAELIRADGSQAAGTLFRTSAANDRSFPGDGTRGSQRLCRPGSEKSE